eukprot:COSAG01_NODE_5569_length_4176_cov_7.015943_4_plen_189_part_00
MNPYEQAGVSQEMLHRALRQLGPTVLKPGLRVAWSLDNPTKNFCFYVTEALLRYAPACEGFLPYKLKIEGERELHRFLRSRDGTIIDLTAEQFGGRALNYGNAQQQNFRSPSRLAHKLAQLCGLEPQPWPERVEITHSAHVLLPRGSRANLGVPVLVGPQSHVMGDGAGQHLWILHRQLIVGSGGSPF